MDRLARIRSYEARFWSKVKIGDGCWEWQASRTVGCGQMFAGDTTRTGGKRMTHAHRMSWMLMYGDIPADTEVMHKCDNRRCVRPSHLQLGTHADNRADAGNKRLMPWGKRHHWRKISVEKARKIKRAVLSGEPIMAIARRLGVNYQLPYDIKRGASWRHLEV